MGNADGNYGRLTTGGDACGSPPGTPKKVLAYSGDGSDLRSSQAGSGPYWVSPEETDASCRFAAGDKIDAYLYISGNHGGTAQWEFKKLTLGDGVVSDKNFQMIPNALWNYGPDGPDEFSKALGPHTESFTLPSYLEAGWHTLRWNWIAPGNVQFVHCIEVEIEESSAPAPSPLPSPPSTTTQTTNILTTSNVITTTDSTTSEATTIPSITDPYEWPTECGETHPCARVAMLTDGEVEISMMGPANVWFGIGFDAVEMRDEPYAIIINGEGVVSERKLAFHSAGNKLEPQVVVLEDSAAGGIRTVLVRRSAIGQSEAHHSFNGEPTNYIYAFGLQSNFGFHGMNFGRWASCVPIGDCDPSWCRVNEAFAWCAAENANTCPDLWCKRGDPSLALPVPAPPTPPTSFEFIPADGGNNRACRGRSPSDNSASYYSLIPGSVPRLEACKAECLTANGCVGIEYNSGFGRCEVWTRPEGIQATASLQGYQCWQYSRSSGSTETTTTMPGFNAVDGGNNRACRGRSPSDNSASYYSLIPGSVPRLEACKAECLTANGCVGIEYNSGSGRCEVWTRPEGIQATASLQGYQCWQYSRSSGSTETTTTMPGFNAVDGGNNRACRGRSPSDNSASYYSLIPGSVPRLEACKAECLTANGCVGIEYNSGSGRCEVWTRPEGIQATASLQGYQCWRYQDGSDGSLLSVRKHIFRGTVLIQNETQVMHAAAVYAEQEL
eukprot:CAMPEP_0197703324 /NCGR_PEP_ID=MMETSP1338-20131121/125377_1 /TAXON_ID=43686 ORGANISM="Pelagodinium beii, Strain RCC1491" /NCGR_SAMPLE_ID=MMETSP1338 /ASSEMBLY_ACC=CAM_ASM_000754 /LENGTH=724 /DNA_ID=CAMNT_0043287219 /DNA_START=177 /DNA_END=2351 /DNA_ORIENTATION=-